MTSPDPVAVLRKFLSAESHRKLAEREREWPDPLTRNEADYRKLIGIHRRLMTEALEEAREIIRANDSEPLRPAFWKAIYEARSFRDGKWLPWYPIDAEVYHNRQRWPRDGYEVRAIETKGPREVYIGPRFSASWMPKGFGSFRAYKGSGWRFLQLWRVRFAVKWAYE